MTVTIDPDGAEIPGTEAAVDPAPPPDPTKPPHPIDTTGMMPVANFSWLVRRPEDIRLFFTHYRTDLTRKKRKEEMTKYFLMLSFLICALTTCNYDHKNPGSPTPASQKPEGMAITITICSGKEPANLSPFPGKDSVPSTALINSLMYDGDLNFPRWYITPTGILKDFSFAVTDTTVYSGSAFWGSLSPYQGVPRDMPQASGSFTLQPDYVWSDGTPVTVRDSIFSFEIYNELPGEPNLWVGEYSAVAPFTIEWTGLPGYIPQTPLKNFWVPLPTHQIEKQLAFPGTQLLEATSKEGGLLLLGFGPFQVSSWNKDRAIVLIRNPYYKKDLNHLNSVSTLILRFSSDWKEAQSLFDSGKCDILGEAVMDKDWLDRKTGEFITRKKQ